MNIWDKSIDSFIKLTNKHDVELIMVGGGAVNFHGHQRHSANVDFWIEPKKENFKKLITVFNKMGYEITDFPKAVKEGNQNISIKFSPTDIDIELITRFSVNKSFDKAYKDSEIAKIKEDPLIEWRVLNLEDLLTSKIKSDRPKILQISNN